MVRQHRIVQGRLLLIVGATALACAGPDKSPNAVAVTGPLEGVWREVGIVVTGRDATTIPNPQPSLYVFTPTHYAMLGTNGGSPRTLFKTIDPTKEERLAAYDSFWGNAGTYEIAGESLTIHPAVARNPNYMAGGYTKYQFRVAGDTLWLTAKSSDQYLRFGDKLVPDTRPVNETRTTLVRAQ